MTTKTSTTNDPDKSLPWWERLTDSSSDMDSGQKTLKTIAILAVVILIGVIVWNFINSSKEKSTDERAQILEAGLVLLPDRVEVNYGTLIDRPNRQGFYETVASRFLRGEEVVGRDSVVGALSDPDAAAVYRDKVEAAITSITDRKSEFSDPEWEARYLHTLQQLHYYAAINSVDNTKRSKHLEEQISILNDLKSRHGDTGLLGLKPLASKPEMSILDLHMANAQAELDFVKSNNLSTKLATDKGLKAVFELENGKSFEVEFYSQAAPMAVWNFIDHAKAGRYNKTAFHELDSEAGTLVGGGIFSRDNPDRKFIWGTENPGYIMTSEATALLPAKKGSICFNRVSTTGHGMHFKIFLIDPDTENTQETVFAEVTSGIEALEEWLSTEVHDEAGLNNKKLPRVRLGIKSVTVTGEIEHPSKDSWKPFLMESKAGPVTAAETAFYEALKKLEEGDKADPVEKVEEGK